ncbi:hypothetical protein J4480_01100 [Candidatus Woesearchaeota archaeon]|nr:hypothetical protein [Candidatus Woesearchaeota archaeon]
MGELIPYKSGHLEKITPQELVKPEDLKLHLPRFYLARNVYVGNFNEAGFVIIDTQPGLKPFWIGFDVLYGYSPKEVQDMIDTHQITEQERYFFDTTGGMAALRFFALSEELMGIFEKDEYLGERMIRKICEKGIVPKEFNEVEIIPEERQMVGQYAYTRTELIKELDDVVNLTLRPPKERTESVYRYYPYVTHFPTQAYGIVTDTLESAVQEAIVRFDEFGEKFRLSETYQELKTNPFLITEHK